MKATAAIGAEARRHTNKWTATVASQANIDVKYLLGDNDLVDLLSVRSEEFNRLIRNLSTEALDRIERQTLGSIFEGRSNADIAKQLQESEGLSRNRARLIARDQASKLNGDMNRFRQEQAGISHYKWKTILDGRERPSHNANNNKIFAWNKPPQSTGHPGNEVNCRCRGLAVITDDPEDLAGLPDEPLGDFFEENLPAIREVALTPKQPVYGFTPDDIAQRLAQTRDLQSKLGAVTKAFSETDAERLMIELYGFKLPDADLDELIGSKIKQMLASPRTKYIAASRARLDMIESQLLHASAEVSTSLNSELLLAKVADPTVKGIKAPALPVNAKSVSAAEVSAKKWLADAAKGKNVEYVISHDLNGNFLAAHTSGKKYAVTLPSKLITKGKGGAANITDAILHHNHISNSSFSKADFKALNKPFIKGVYAHTPDGSTFSIQGGGFDQAYKIEKGYDRVIKATKALVKKKKIPAELAEFIASHAASLGAAESMGIKYVAKLGPKLSAAAKKYSSEIAALRKEMTGFAKEFEAKTASKATEWSKTFARREPAAPRPEWLKALPEDGRSTDAAGLKAQRDKLVAVTRDAKQKEWVERYSGSGYREINSYLRGGKQRSAKLDDGIKAIDAALSDFLPEGTTLYRGVSLPKSITDKMVVGTTLTDSAFASTSTRLAFSQSWAGSDSVLMVINGRGLRGLDIRSISTFEHEDEILLMRGQKMVITRIASYNGQKYVFLEKA